MFCCLFFFDQLERSRGAFFWFSSKGTQVHPRLVSFSIENLSCISFLSLLSLRRFSSFSQQQDLQEMYQLDLKLVCSAGGLNLQSGPLSQAKPWH
jgi:hypothetical protein